MSLVKYPEYKDSGVAWLGVLPKHWATSRLKHAVSTPITDGPHETPIFGDVGVPFVSAEAVSSGEVNFDRIRGHISLEDHQRFSLKYKPELHDIYMVKSGATTGTTAIVETSVEFNIWSPLAAIRCDKDKCLPHFVLSFLRSRNFQEAVSLNWSFGTQQNIGMGVLGDLPISVPPLAEQTAIATFLGRETGKINSLIAEQEKLIALLAEKRQATISHAVTKGLNSNAPMKDSGVAWLGNVPAHWTVQSIKHLVSTPITDGPHETPNFPDDGIPFVSAEAVSGGFIDFEKIRGYISAEDHQRYSTKYKPQLHDIYMVKSGATTGVTAIVETDTEFNIWSPLAAIRCDRQKAEPYFVLAALRSRNFQEGVALNWSFGTQQNIGMGVLGDLPIALPPLAEQREIAAFLALETPKLNTLGSEATRAIALLKERRSALIAAAVTGQIDVRGAVLDEVGHGRR